MHAAGVAA
jgi:hypothetical protein